MADKSITGKHVTSHNDPFYLRPDKRSEEVVFIDSGAFTLWTQKARKYGRRHNCDPIRFYQTKEFRSYMRRYARFVKRMRRIGAVDHYANVDAISLTNPQQGAEITYRNQKILEKHGLRPVPVVHFKADVNWLARYIEEGYEYIGLGGLVGSISNPRCIQWLSQAFDVICDTPDRLPRVKVHGFGMSRFDLMSRYPWYSIDTTSWAKTASYGMILVPSQDRQGRWRLCCTKRTTMPLRVPISVDSPAKNKSVLVGTRHFDNLNRDCQRWVLDWLEFIQLPLGSKDCNFGDRSSYGVRNRATYRKVANMRYYELFRKTLPEWPWPFVNRSRKGLLSNL